MGNKREGQIVAVFPTFQPFFQIFFPGNHYRSPAPSRDGQHLGMVGGSHNHRLPAPIFCLRYNFMDVGHVGAGGVQHLHPPPGKLLVDGPALPVGADNHRRPVRHLLRAVHHPEPLGGQPPGHVPVVDQGAQHNAGHAPGGLLPGQLYRPAHTVAETGRPCHYDLHPTPSPRACTRSIRSCAITWSSSLEGLRPSYSG